MTNYEVIKLVVLGNSGIGKTATATHIPTVPGHIKVMILLHSSNMVLSARLNILILNIGDINQRQTSAGKLTCTGLLLSSRKSFDPKTRRNNFFPTFRHRPGNPSPEFAV